MRKLLFHLLLSLTILILISSFSSGEGIIFPAKKVQRTINKIWKTENAKFEEFNIQTQVYSGKFYSITEKGQLLGYLYVGRVNSCRSGGCSINGGGQDLSFEFFDYFFVTDSLANIRKVKIFNYQATHGHEVMSSGWLRQFKGYNGSKELRYGHEIEAISGATISAKAINEDLQLTVKMLKSEIGISSYLSEKN